MHWTAPGRVLIAWDSGQGPTFARTSGGAYLRRKAFASFDVYRTTDPADLTGVLIGSTCAEAFLDRAAPEGLVVWYRVVGHMKAGGTLPVGGRITAIVPRRMLADADTTPPSEPDGFKVRLRDEGNLLTWQASCDAESGLLAYFVYESNQDQPDSVVWANEAVRRGSHAVCSFLDRTKNAKKRYYLRALDCALNLSDGPVSFAKASGWTVYRFTTSGEFRLRSRHSVDCDVLLVGGGGTGGAGNCQGSGGGGGGVVDRHRFTIVAGKTDGAVTVGEGGFAVSCEAAAADNHGNNGGDSSFGGLVAPGGGYGGGEGENPSYFDYPAADGGSGGGGDPWSAGVPEDVVEGEYHWHMHGHGGKAIAEPYLLKTRIPAEANFWEHMRTFGYAGGNPTGTWTDTANDREYWLVEREQGHDGGDGQGHLSYYNINGGGGGGAHDLHKRDADGEIVYFEGTTNPVPYFDYDQFGYMQSTNPLHGKHGVPCDIAGWHYYEVSGMGDPYPWQISLIEWFGGGGAGKERRTWWSYPDGKPGYGGGGEVNQQGADGAGGGGGGGGNYPEDMPGPAGGNGVVIIRIRTADEDLVKVPQILGPAYEPGTQDPVLTNGHPTFISSVEGIEITRLPEYMTHDDQSGDELCPRTYEEVHS